MKALLHLFLLIFFAAGCSTIKPYNGFVGSIDMSSLGTFEYRYTQIRENDFSDRQKSILRELSGPVITKALIERGFIPSEGNADFYVLTQWEKEFDLDYGTNDSSRNYDEDSGEYRDDSVDEQPFGTPISLSV